MPHGTQKAHKNKQDNELTYGICLVSFQDTKTHMIMKQFFLYIYYLLYPKCEKIGGLITQDPPYENRPITLLPMGESNFPLSNEPQFITEKFIQVKLTDGNTVEATLDDNNFKLNMEKLKKGIRVELKKIIYGSIETEENTEYEIVRFVQ